METKQQVQSWKTYPLVYKSCLTKGVLKSIGTWIVTIHVLLACPVLLTTFSSDMERLFHLDAEIETYRITYARYFLRTLTMIFVCVLAVRYVKVIFSLRYPSLKI